MTQHFVSLLQLFTVRLSVELLMMGSKKRRQLRRSASTSQALRYPIGELAKRRNNLKENFLSKSKELNALKKRIDRAKTRVSFQLALYKW